MIYQETLRSLRVKFGMTQLDVANLLGVTQKTYNKYERDASTLSYKQLCMIESIYGITKDHIFFGPESAFSGIIKESAMQKAEVKTRAYV